MTDTPAAPTTPRRFGELFGKVMQRHPEADARLVNDILRIVHDDQVEWAARSTPAETLICAACGGTAAPVVMVPLHPTCDWDGRSTPTEARASAPLDVREVRDALDAQAELLACYRIGKHPSGRLLDRVGKANDLRARLSPIGGPESEDTE